MKIPILRTLASLSLAAALGCFSLQAQTRGQIHVTVPFDFTVGARSFAAGEYRVNQQAPHVLAIRSVSGDSTMVIMANPAEPGPLPDKATLTFNKYGDRYFLSRVSDNTSGWELPKSRVEKELAQRLKQGPTRPVTLSAGEQ